MSSRRRGESAEPLKHTSAQLDFEQCIEIRETIAKLKAKMRKAQG